MIEHQEPSGTDLLPGSNTLTEMSSEVVNPDGITRTLLVAGTTMDRVDLTLPPPYRELGQVAVRKQLGLNPTTEKQLQANSAEYAKDAEKFSAEAFKSTPQNERVQSLRRRGRKPTSGFGGKSRH